MILLEKRLYELTLKDFMEIKTTKVAFGLFFIFLRF